jgi:nitroreductase
MSPAGSERSTARDILEIMWQRHSSRGPFDPARRVSESVLCQILDAARWAPTVHNLQRYEIIAVDDPSVLTQICEIRLRPIETFSYEPAATPSLSAAEDSQQRFGLLASMFPKSWLEIDEEQGATPRQAYLGRFIQPCPMMLFILNVLPPAASATDPVGLDDMSLGCVMQNMWLMAENCGLSAQVITGFGGGAEGAAVRSILTIPEGITTGFAMRLGYPLHAEGSQVRVRRRVQDYLHRNRFGRT